jgi:hypothetical protein
MGELFDAEEDVSKLDEVIAFNPSPPETPIFLRQQSSALGRISFFSQ